MSKYTTEVRYICENAAGLDASVGLTGVEEVLAKAYPKIFAPDLELFDQEYKATLFPKILRHFYTREIGYETAALWQFWLNARMREILPYYNQLYKSALVEFDPLENVNLTTTHEQTDTGDRDESGTSHTDDVGKENTDAWSKLSDTPQGGLNGVASDAYLTAATHNITDNSHDNDTDNQYTGNVDTVDTINYTHTEKGKNGGFSYSKMLGEWRETFLNIDEMLIARLEDLFMGVF